MEITSCSKNIWWFLWPVSHVAAPCTVRPKVNKEMTKRRKTQRRIKFSICLNPNEASQGANVSFIPLEVKAENSWGDIKRNRFLFCSVPRRQGRLCLHLSARLSGWSLPGTKPVAYHRTIPSEVWLLLQILPYAPEVRGRVDGGDSGTAPVWEELPEGWECLPGHSGSDALTPPVVKRFPRTQNLN